jgi:hypothetical protein
MDLFHHLDFVLGQFEKPFFIAHNDPPARDPIFRIFYGMLADMMDKLLSAGRLDIPQVHFHLSISILSF